MKLINAPVFRGVALDNVRQNVYGVEIELENYKGTWTWAPKFDGKPFWSLVDDPSLRKGIELVSCKMTQVKTKAALVAAQKAINLMKLTSASRCGVHVHVNMLNLTWGQMWSFMALYTFMEPEIFAKFAPERHDNHFCVPMAWNTKLAADLGRDIDMLRSFNVGDIDYTQPDRGYRPGKGMGLQAPHNIQFTAQTDPAGQMETAAPPMYTGGNNKRWFPLKKYMTSLGRHKYGAMTGYRMPDLGTVEIRLLPGTTDMSIIEDWVALLARIKHMAYKFAEPLDLQAYYERHGPEYIWRVLQMGKLPSVSMRTKDEAEECAYKIIGNKPRGKEDFEWNMD